MAITEITLSSLKQAKNAVIGNPTAKRALARDEALIGTLANFIYDPEASSEPSDDLRVEAAHILASLSYGSSEALRTLLRANALQALLLAISHTGPSTSLSLRAALARALKTLGAAVADIIGPAQWGLQDDHPDIQEEARAALEALFQMDALDTYLPLLISTSPSSPQISSSISHLLASTLRLPLYRNAVAEWSPPAERQKESVVRGKRGWEKSEGTSSHPSRGGGWVARVLVGLLERKDVKHQEAALLALASLAKDNPAVATSLTRPTTDHPPVLTTVLSCCKSRATDLQLAACLCATNIFRASAANAPPHTHLDQTAPMTVIHVMNGLIEAEGESPRTRMKACYIIYYLVADDKDLCQLAYERGSLAKLATLVKSITPSDTTDLGWGWDEDEPESDSALRAAALTSIASISLFDTDIRASISGPLRLIPTIHLSLSSSSPSVRFAACQCVRALSRAVAVLRTNLVDSGLGLKVYEGVFCREGEDSRVLHAAASVICNIISDFSPLQATLLERGVIERLVRLLQSGEESLMLDALWAFKNLLYKSTLELKGRVMRALCWESVASLLVHDNPGFQEQTFHILRNLADSQEGIAMIFDELGSEYLLSSLSHALESDNEDVLRQAVYLTGNLSNSPTHSPQILSHTPILHALRLCLVDAKPDVRRPAVTAVLQLIKANPSGAQKALRESGIDSTLRHMCDYGGGIGYMGGSGFGGGIGGVGGGGGSPTAGRLHGGGGFGHMGVEDDREVKEKAREALNRLQVVFPELE